MPLPHEIKRCGRSCEAHASGPCAQFCNHLEVTILPPYMPSAAERADARLYAANVRALMGAALGAPLSVQGIAQQQALKRAGVQVDWTGRRVDLQPII